MCTPQILTYKVDGAIYKGNSLLQPGSYNLSLIYACGVATISRLLNFLVSLQNIGLFCRALLQRRPIILRSLLIVATP